jgi:aspartyl-tRNA(Asn)/glutamyl-tRNA(Gln) amidotransferase subunit C
VSKTKVTPSDVEHIAKLAQIPVSENEKQEFAKAFEETLGVVDELRELDVSKTKTTHQVTGLENIWREDVVEKEKMFSQKEALANSDNTHQGYFVVNRILEEKDN